MISLLICSAMFTPEKTLVTGCHSFSMVRDLSEEMKLRRAQLHALISKINVKTIISELFFIIINCVFFDYFLMIKSKNVLQLTRTWLWFKFQSVFSASRVTLWTGHQRVEQLHRRHTTREEVLLQHPVQKPHDDQRGPLSTVAGTLAL